ncbi:flagellar filament capping protein FliD [Kineococcus sp. SYSU DK018]|uniref:flagellar filament capping protein FliD n=1 Tax=Kineococcus sp. SYSU DK018 TaxID=3383139 RepID=UPI003D7D2219
MASVDGLVSGMDTTSIISQLIAVDSAPQARLKSSVSAAQLKVTAYQSVNSKMSALQTAADNLQKATAWTPVKATSSSSAVTVTAGSTASTGSLSIEVTGLASARSVVSPEFTLTGGKVDPTAPPLSYPLDVVRSDGSYVTLQPSSGTLSEVVDAINEAEGFGIKAVAIRVGADANGNPSYRLQITSTQTGSGNDFKLVPHGTRAVSNVSNPLKLQNLSPAESFAGVSEPTDPTKALTELSKALDATVSLGGSPAVVVKSSTNTFTDVMPGVSVTVSAKTETGKPATVSVTKDSSAVASAVQSLVDAANAALTEISVQSRAGALGSDGKVTGGGTLRGDSTMRTLKSQILSAVTSAVGASEASAATFGLQSTRDGELTFDKTKFLEAYAKDPAGVQALVSTRATDPDAGAEGVVERLRAVTVGAIGDLKLSSAATGTLTSVIDGQNSSIKDLTSRIADWDTRLAAKKERYQKYYGALETALGKLQSQSTWLAGQLGSLPSGSSN